MTSPLRRVARGVLLVTSALVAATAIAGGGLMALGSLVPLGATPFTPPSSYLAGSPFTGYLLPGLVLLLVVGGLHTLAAVEVLRRRPSAPAVAAVAAFGMLIWIFVQVLVIPFSVLQVVYEALGIVELAAVLGMLGVVDPLESRLLRH